MPPTKLAVGQCEVNESQFSEVPHHLMRQKRGALFLEKRDFGNARVPTAKEVELLSGQNGRCVHVECASQRLLAARL
jgi:hypothetical protein